MGVATLTLPPGRGRKRTPLRSGRNQIRLPDSGGCDKSTVSCSRASNTNGVRPEGNPRGLSLCLRPSPAGRSAERNPRQLASRLPGRPGLKVSPIRAGSAGAWDRTHPAWFKIPHTLEQMLCVNVVLAVGRIARSIIVIDVGVVVGCAA